MSHTLRRIAWFRLTALILALIALGATGFLGVHNVFNERSEAVTALQKSVTVGGGIYGILGVITALGLILRKSWAVRSAIAWAIVLTYTGSAANPAYAEMENLLIPTLSAFALCAVVAALVVWLTKVGSRQIVSYDETSG